jgi:hypothetical protein
MCYVGLMSVNAYGAGAKDYKWPRTIYNLGSGSLAPSSRTRRKDWKEVGVLRDS